MNQEELRKKNLDIINRATKLTKFMIGRVVRSDGELFGSPTMTVDNAEFNKLIESMILDRIKSRHDNGSYTRTLEVL